MDLRKLAGDLGTRNVCEREKPHPAERDICSKLLNKEAGGKASWADPKECKENVMPERAETKLGTNCLHASTNSQKSLEKQTIL